MPTVTRTMSLEEMTLRQLRRLASSYGVSRYSRMRKLQLVEAIESIELNQQGVEIPSRRFEAQEEVGAAKFNLGQASTSEESLALLDEHLEDLPDGYGESRIVIMPRDPQWAYVYWDLPNDAREAVRRQGGEILTLRLYDVTGLEEGVLPSLSIQDHSCDELAREWYLSLPISDRDYQAEIGYRTQVGEWLPLAQSGRVHVPPIYPSEWVEDYFVKVSWEEELVDRSPIYALQIPANIPQRVTEEWVFHASSEYPNGSGHQMLSSYAVGSGHMTTNGHQLQQFLNPTLEALPLAILFQAEEMRPDTASIAAEDRAVWRLSYSV